MSKSTIRGKEVSATEEQEVMDNVFKIAPGVWRMKDIFVNVYILQNAETDKWVLVDTGLKSSGEKIKKMVREVLGNKTKPEGIIMTHGHSDHRGSVQQLANEWAVPVYAHHMELPYLTGKSSYPPADPSVGGGLMASLSFILSTKPIDVGEYLRELPLDNSVPGLPEWKWIHTPGHTPGHISLFREKDAVLVAGDAVVTTKQESAFSILTQKVEMSGPPKYLTPDWGSAARSTKELAALQPNIIASGHGHAMYGQDAKKGLNKLARNFWQLGMPQTGRYVSEPALFDEDGPTYVPPTSNNYMWLRIAGATAMVVVGYLLYKNKQKSLAKTLMAGSVSMLTAPVPTI